MLMDRAELQAGDRVLIWGAAGGLGVFATQLVQAAGAESVGVVSSDGEGRAGQADSAPWTTSTATSSPG